MHNLQHKQHHCKALGKEKFRNYMPLHVDARNYITNKVWQYSLCLSLSTNSLSNDTRLTIKIVDLTAQCFSQFETQPFFQHSAKFVFGNCAEVLSDNFATEKIRSAPETKQFKQPLIFPKLLSRFSWGKTANFFSVKNFEERNTSKPQLVLFINMNIFQYSRAYELFDTGGTPSCNRQIEKKDQFWISLNIMTIIP